MPGNKIFVDRVIREVSVMIAGRLGVVSTEEICYTCHDGSVRDSRDQTWMPGGHPVYVIPSENVQVPKTFPLNKDGKIYCGTCHSAHGVDWGKKQEEQMLERTVFLRFENPNSFICKQCHVNKVRSKAHNNHPVDVTTIKIPQEVYDLGGKTGFMKDQVICQSCHRVHGAKGGYKLLIKSIKNSELCGICHKDKYVDDRAEAEKRGTHPVNIVPKYAQISQEAKNRGSREGSDGKIICLSCHKIHNAPEGTKILLASNSGSNLCRLCHQDKYDQISSTKHDLRETAPNEKNIWGQSPESGGLCSACHLPHGGQGAKMWARKPANNNEPIARLCLSCHSEGEVAKKKQLGKISHPVGVSITKVDGETSLPLWSEEGVKILDGKKGNVNCASCHNVHRWDANSMEKKDIAKVEGDAANSFLRIKNDVGSPLCNDCHEDKSYIENSDHDMSMMAYKHPRSHCIQMLGEDQSEMLKLPKETVHKLLGKSEGKTGICGTCHTPHNALYYRLWSREIGPGANAGEKLCFTCHAAGRVAEVKQLGQYTHPTGASILNLGITPTTNLPLFDDELNRVKNGKVMCFSCHNPHRWDPNKKEKGPGVKTEGDASNSFLRIAANDNNFAICASCHGDKWPIKNTKHDLALSRPKEKNLRGQTTSEVGVCGACHIVHNAAYKYRLWNRPLGPGDDPVAKLCQSCHSDGRCAEVKQIGKNTHPLGKDIRGALQGKAEAPNFPTYDDDLAKVSPGKVYCSSCHNLHQWDAEKAEQGDGKLAEGDMTNSFLRAKNTDGYAFCIKCHPKKDTVVGTDHDMRVSAPNEKNYFGVSISKGGVCSACHVVHNTLNDVKLWARELGPGTDGISKLCRSCHNENGPAKTKLISFGKDSHPINADIRKAEGSTSFPLFNFAGYRDKNGKVYCASCHDPHLWDAAQDKGGPGVPVEGDQSNSFLRKRNLPSPDFCGDCHPEKALVEGTDHDMNITAPAAKNLAGRTVKQDGICSACHIVHNGYNEVRLWARKWGPPYIQDWNKLLGVESDRAVQFCTSCHSDNEPAQVKQPKHGLHPYPFLVGIRKAFDTQWVPSYQPLKYVYKTLNTVMTNRMMDDNTRPAYPPYTDSGEISLDNGDLTCPTCHNPHKWYQREFKKGTGVNEEGRTNTSFLRKDVLYEFCIDCHSYDALYRMKYFHSSRTREKLDPPTKYDEIRLMLKNAGATKK
ncbi:MAG: hypothetical protein HZA78_10035 [Candidatus Schekmanbacteria bacterium]|nr:hypothetical protein [Candidatus Schekmanbacteria bacterium]